MKKYLKKHSVVEAIQFDGKNSEEIIEWINGNCTTSSEYACGPLFLRISINGKDLRIYRGDWVIRSTEEGADFDVCIPNFFETNYEKLYKFCT